MTTIAYPKTITILNERKELLISRLKYLKNNKGVVQDNNEQFELMLEINEIDLAIDALTSDRLKDNPCDFLDTEIIDVINEEVSRMPPKSSRKGNSE